VSQQTPAPPPPQYDGQPKPNRGPLILIGVLGLVLIAVLALGAVVLLRNDDKPAVTKVATRPATPESVQFRSVLKAEPNGCSASTPAGTACGSDGTRYTLGKVALDGTHVSEVKAAKGTDLAWVVNLTLDDEGGRLFEQLTAELSTKTPPQNQLAIVVRGRVVTAPTVMSPIPGGQVQISSNFTQSDAEKTAADITG
jgi:preprotein translocase subunit SecD